MYTNTGSRACVSLKGNILSTVKSYNITRKTSSPHSGVTSNSKGGTLAVAGALDWSAGCVSWHLTPGMLPGEEGVFKGCQGLNDMTEGTAVIHEGDCVCTQLSTSIDVKNRAPIEWTYSFQGAGKLTESTGNMTDSTTPEVVRPVAAAFSVTKGSGGGSTEHWNLAQVSITISSSVSGGGATSSSEGWFRRLGGPMNFSFDMTFENDRVEDLSFDVGDDLKITISLDNDETIEISWIHVTGFGDATLDNASAEPITIPASGTMNAYSLQAEEYGAILIGGSQIWPKSQGNS